MAKLLKKSPKPLNRMLTSHLTCALYLVQTSVTQNRIDRQAPKKLTETSQSHVDFSSRLCSFFGTDEGHVGSDRMRSAPKKTPRHPSRMLNSYLTCVLYLGQSDEVHADIRVGAGAIRKTPSPLGLASVGDAAEIARWRCDESASRSLAESYVGPAQLPDILLSRLRSVHQRNLVGTATSTE